MTLTWNSEASPRLNCRLLPVSRAWISNTLCACATPVASPAPVAVDTLASTAPGYTKTAAGEPATWRVCTSAEAAAGV